MKGLPKNSPFYKKIAYKTVLSFHNYKYLNKNIIINKFAFFLFWRINDFKYQLYVYFRNALSCWRWGRKITEMWQTFSIAQYTGINFMQ